MWRDLLVTLAAAPVFASILLAGGSRVRRLLRLPCPPSLAGPVEWCLGSLALGLPVLLCGLAGAFRPLPLLGVVAALAATGRWRGWRRRARDGWPFWAAAVPLLPVALAPPFFYDAWVYHLGLPWQALADGALRAHPENLFATFPPLAQLIYAPALAAGLTRLPGMVHLLTFCFAGQAAAGLARRLGAMRVPATLAGIGVLYLPSGTAIAGFPAAEGWAVLAVAAGLGLVLTGRPGRASALLGGLVVGTGAAARLQGVPWAALLVLASLWRGGGRLRPAEGLLTAAGALAGSAPWWIKNGVLLGRPWHPIGLVREGVETLWRDAGSAVYLAPDLWDAVGRAFAALGGRAWMLGPAAAVGSIGALLGRRKRTGIVLAAAAAGGLVWGLTGGYIGRFLGPTMALLLAAAVASRRRAIAWGGLAVIVATCSLPGTLSTGRLLSRFDGLALVGKPDEVYSRMVKNNPYPGFNACERLAPDARILLVGEPRGFLLPRRFVAGSQHDPSPLAAVMASTASTDDAIRALAGLGFTHLLLNFAEIERLAKEEYPLIPWRDEEQRARVRDLVGALGEPVVVEGPVVVWALDSGG